MDRSGLDDKISDLFDGYESPIHMDQAWASLQNRRKPKRRPIFWWLPLGVGALLIVFILFLTTRNNPVNKELTEPIIVQIEPEKTDNKNDVINLPDPHHHQNKQKDVTADATKQAAIISLLEEGNNGTSIITKTQQREEAIKNNTTLSRIVKINKEVQVQIVPVASLEQKEISPIWETGMEEVNSFKNLSIDPLPLLDYPLFNIKEKLTVFPNAILEQKSHKLPILLGFSGSYGQPFRSLESLDENYIQTKNYRQAIESTVDVKELAISVRKNISSSIFLQSGIIYNNIATRLRAKNTSATEVEIPNQLVIVRKHQDGTLEEIREDVTTPATAEIQYDFWQNINTIEVPLILGLHTNYSSKFNYSIAFGIQSGFSALSGETIELNTGNLQELSALPYRKFGHIKGILQTDLMYTLSDKWKLTLGLKYLHSLNSITKTNAGFTEKYQSLSGQLGVWYQW